MRLITQRSQVQILSPLPTLVQVRGPFAPRSEGAFAVHVGRRRPIWADIGGRRWTQLPPLTCANAHVNASRRAAKSKISPARSRAARSARSPAWDAPCASGRTPTWATSPPTGPTTAAPKPTGSSSCAGASPAATATATTTGSECSWSPTDSTHDPYRMSDEPR